MQHDTDIAEYNTALRNIQQESQHKDNIHREKMDEKSREVETQLKHLQEIHEGNAQQQSRLLDQTQSELRRINADYDQLRGDLQRLQEESLNNETDHEREAHYNRSMTAQQNTITQLENEKRAMEDILQARLSESEAEKARVADLRHQISALKEQLEAKRDLLAERDNRVVEQNTAIVEYERNVHRLGEDEIRLRYQIKHMQAEVPTLLAGGNQVLQKLYEESPAFCRMARRLQCQRLSFPQAMHQTRSSHPTVFPFIRVTFQENDICCYYYPVSRDELESASKDIAMMHSQVPESILVCLRFDKGIFGGSKPKQQKLTCYAPCYIHRTWESQQSLWFLEPRAEQRIGTRQCNTRQSTQARREPTRRYFNSKSMRREWKRGMVHCLKLL